MNKLVYKYFKAKLFNKICYYFFFILKLLKIFRLVNNLILIIQLKLMETQH